MAKPEMVVEEPAPVISPGLIVQFNSGKPVNITLPVARVQEGWVIAPAAGASMDASGYTAM